MITLKALDSAQIGHATLIDLRKGTVRLAVARDVEVREYSSGTDQRFFGPNTTFPFNAGDEVGLDSSGKFVKIQQI